MLDKNKFNPACSNSEQIISYFYKEMDAAEKNNFEVHLLNCAACIDELSGFDTVHSSISEWRSVEFNNLETPEFNFLPRAREVFVASSLPAENNWWITLRDRYFSPLMIWATPALAVLLICFGLTYIFYNLQNTEVAEIDTIDKSNIVSPAIKTNNLGIQKDSNSNIIEKPSENFSSEEKQLNVQTTIASSNVLRAGNYAVKIANNSNRTANRKSVSARKFPPFNKKSGNSAEIKKTPSSKTRNIPFLADIEEIEDDSLRLADLFDDADTE